MDKDKVFVAASSEVFHKFLDAHKDWRGYVLASGGVFRLLYCPTHHAPMNAALAEKLLIEAEELREVTE